MLPRSSTRGPHAPRDPEAEPAHGVLVVGYGNTLRSDDGVGPVVAACLAADPRLRGADVRIEHQLTPELAADVSGARLLVLVDAADDVPAGEVRVREVAAAGSPLEAGHRPPRRSEEAGVSFTHHLDPSSLLGLADQLWGSAPRTVLVGVGPATLELGDRLSPEVRAAVPTAIEAAAAAVVDAGAGPPGESGEG